MYVENAPRRGIGRRIPDIRTGIALKGVTARCAPLCWLAGKYEKSILEVYTIVYSSKI
jgi:hypothetical protein